MIIIIINIAGNSVTKYKNVQQIHLHRQSRHDGG